jgi:peroxiredoxin Q/BCP
MKIGERVADFVLPDQDGQPTSLRELAKDGSVVLFFYPIALSGGCTAESCHFRDLSSEFAAAGANVVGISRDTIEKQKAFDTAHQLGYRLLSDRDGTVAGQFGVRRRWLPVAPVKRATFVIGPDLVVRAVVRSESNMTVHADTALAALA